MRHNGPQAFVKGFPENNLADTEITSTPHKCPCPLLSMKSLPHLMISVLNPGSSEIQNTEHHYPHEDHFPPFYKHLLLKHQISRAKFKNRCFENCIHTVPGNSETCKVFPGQFMPDVSGWDVCLWSLCAWGDLNEWGSMGGDRQSTHGAQLGFWSFNSFTPLTLLPSSDWRQVQNI